MADSKNNNSKNTDNQNTQHETLQQRLNSIDKKLNGEKDAFDLDAMLDKAESTLSPTSEFQDEDDALDRLLMNAGFEEDDALMPEEVNNNDDLDELDDLLSFDSFGDDLLETETAAVPEQVVGASVQSSQFDEDDLDRLVMNTALDGDFLPEQGLVDDVEDHDELNTFSDFSDFDDPGTVSEASSDQQEPASSPANQRDELDDFLSSIGDFDESDMIQDDVPARAESIPVTPVTDEEPAIEDVGDVDGLDSFSDFSDFNEPDIIPVDLREDVNQSSESPIDNDELADDDLFVFDGLADGFDESELTQDDETSDAVDLGMAENPEIPILEDIAEDTDFAGSVTTDLALTSEDIEPEQIEASAPAPENEVQDIEQDDELFDFEGLADGFDESELIQDDEASDAVDLGMAKNPEIPILEDIAEDTDFAGSVTTDLALTSEDVEPEQIEASASAPENEVQDIEQDDELFDFEGLADGFDDSDLIQDEDEVTTNDEQEVVIEQSIDEASPEISSFDDSDLAGEDSFDVADEVIGKDDLQGIADDFDESDLIFDDENNIDELVETTNSDQNGLLDSLDIKDEIEASNDIDDFTATDLIPDDEPETTLDDAISTDEEQSSVEDELAGNVLDDPDSFNKRFENFGSDADDLLDLTDAKDETDAQNVADDFAGLIDDFAATDLIQDDESATAVSIAADETQPLAADQLVSDDMDDDERFNSLFADADFSEQDTIGQQAPEESVEFGDDTGLSDIDSLFQLNDENDNFTVHPEDGALAGDIKSPVQDDKEDDFLLPDFDITADTEISDTGVGAKIAEDELLDDFGKSDFMDDHESMPTSDPVMAEPNPAVKEDVPVDNIEDVKLNPFDFELEDLKKQLESAESKVKKTKRYSYLAMGFGAVALTAAAGLGVMTYQAKTEVSRLTEAVSKLGANPVQSTANVPGAVVDGTNHSTASAEHVDGLASELKNHPEVSADLLNHKLPNILEKQDMVSKELDKLLVKVGNLEEKISSATPAAVAPSKVEATPVKEENKHESTMSRKNKSEHEPVKDLAKHDIHDSKHSAEHEHGKGESEVASVKKETVHEQLPAKENEPTAAKQKPQPEPAPVKPNVPAKTDIEAKPEKVNKPAAIGKWGVNLAAFKQEWFAKSKAAEYARQGIFAEVIPIHEGNNTMYRLRVGGFKTRAEASANTARIKQALNLDSVWVSDN
jgi:cell division protein FtsN